LISIYLVHKYLADPDPGLSQKQRWQGVLADMLSLHPGHSLSESTARTRYSALQVDLKAYNKSAASGAVKDESDVLKALRDLEDELGRLEKVSLLLPFTSFRWLLSFALFY
jgi:hypothetical protein